MTNDEKKFQVWGFQIIIFPCISVLAKGKTQSCTEIFNTYHKFFCVNLCNLWTKTL